MDGETARVARVRVHVGRVDVDIVRVGRVHVDVVRVVRGDVDVVRVDVDVVYMALQCGDIWGTFQESSGSGDIPGCLTVVCSSHLTPSN